MHTKPTDNLADPLDLCRRMRLGLTALGAGSYDAYVATREHGVPDYLAADLYAYEPAAIIQRFVEALAANVRNTVMHDLLKQFYLHRSISIWRYAQAWHNEHHLSLLDAPENMHDLRALAAPVTDALFNIYRRYNRVRSKAVYDAEHDAMNFVLLIMNCADEVAYAERLRVRQDHFRYRMSELDNVLRDLHAIFACRTVTA